MGVLLRELERVRASGVREDAIAMVCDSRQGVRKAGSEVPAPPLFTPCDALLLPPALALTPLGVLAAPRRVRP